MTAERLSRQIEFISEIDQLKKINRQVLVGDKSRQENPAEHSWHIAVMALLLLEHASGELDVFRVVKMLLVHDIVEVDAGDTFSYDEAAQVDKAAREQQAAERLFGLLPDDQADEFHRLWQEFEARETPEAKFASAIDHLQPVLLNSMSEGHAWRKHQVSAEQVLARNAFVEKIAPGLLAEVERRVAYARQKKWLGE